jgi:glutamate transport system substrate-binding protein
MRMKRRSALLLSLAAILALAAAGCGQSVPGGGVSPKMPAGSTMEAIQKRGKLIVGTKMDQPLFGWRGLSGKPEGFDVEVARKVSLAIFGNPTSVQWVETVSKNREPFIEQGKVDIVTATYTINDARKKEVDFAGPYYIAGQDIMVRSVNDSIRRVQDLSGKKVCTARGSTSEKNLARFAPQAIPVLFDGYAQCAEALGDGRVEAVTTDNSVLLGFVQKSRGAYKLVGRPFSEEPYGIGLRKGDSQFRAFLNDVLVQMYKDGSWKTAYDATIGQVQPQPPAPPPVDRY